MSNSNARCKRDYEDLDDICESSVHGIQRDEYLSPIGPQPTFFQSDSAIHVTSQPTKAHNYTLGHSTAASIPCIFRIGVAHSVKENLRNFPQENFSEEKQNICGCLKPADRKENFWLLYFACIYAMFIILGSFCIKFIEAPIEQELRKNYTLLREGFFVKYPNISDDLEEFVNFVTSANDLGISILESFTNKTEWNFGQALFFSTSLVTTVGYGHITPRSQAGKIFCLIFSAIGIPLTLIFFNAMVERLLTPSNYLLKLLMNKFNNLYKTTIIRLIHLSIIACLAFILFFAIPIISLSYLEEKWSTLDAFYFCFMSLTTIGLGDFVPGETTPATYQSLYKIISSIYLILGIVGMMVVVTVYYEIPQINIGMLFTKNYETKGNIPESNVNDRQNRRKSSKKISCVF